MQYKTGDQGNVISKWFSKYHQPRKVTQDEGDLLLETDRQTDRQRQTETDRQRHRERERDLI